MNEASVTLNAIEEARARLKGLVHETPLDHFGRQGNLPET